MKLSPNQRIRIAADHSVAQAYFGRIVRHAVLAISGTGGDQRPKVTDVTIILVSIFMSHLRLLHDPHHIGAEIVMVVMRITEQRLGFAYCPSVIAARGPAVEAPYRLP